MKRLILKIIIIFLIMLCIPQRIYASETDDFYSNQIFDEMFSQGDLSDFDMQETAEDIAEGEYDFSFKSIIKYVLNIFSKELVEQGEILKKLAVMTLLCGFLQNAAEAFGRKEIAKTGFFVCTIYLIYLVLSSLKIQCQYVYDITERISGNIKILIPAFAAAVASSGRAVTFSAMLPVILFLSTFLMFVIKSVLIPVITGISMLECVNCVSDKNILSNMCELVKKCINIFMKLCAFIFVGILSFQRIGTGQLSGFVGKAAKNVVSAVPVVGDIMRSSIDAASSVSSLITNSMAAAGIIMVVTISAVPIIKIAVMWFIYKITAAFAEPIGESKITKALNSAGDMSAVLLSAVFVISFMYVFSIIIMLVSF
jgi:stage III sporulation protein AE